MSFEDALKEAENKNLDLVLLNSKANPPVCKIMDYGKFKFDSLKKAKELKKNQNIPELKGIRLSMTIDKHDLETKAKQASKFLISGNKIKVFLRMRGRQNAFAQTGLQVMQQFYAMLEEYGNLDKQPQVMGKNIFMIITPKKQ